MKKEVLVIFKTHLDIGYTDYSKNVVENYFNNFIPNAIRVGYELKGTNTPFIWTVGSWLIWEALKQDRDGVVEKAIKDGIITWHALPFTSHTELMNEELFCYGLSLSEKLDARFLRKTIGSKMTDVPGHTVSMVPIMKKHGIEFLHIGVNEATRNPDVPGAFRWKNGEDEIIVVYEDGYGADTEFDDFAICFAHTNDNLGPQSAEDIKGIYEKLAKKYPDCDIKAATLDDVADRMLKIKESLPIVEAEIGDSWIHGAGTDPKKVGMYRELLRHIEKYGIGDAGIDDNLLIVPEHTWGMCVQKYFSNQTDWFEADLMADKNRQEREFIEKSWEEQRSYVKKAAELLGADVDYSLSEPDTEGFEEIHSEPFFEISWQIFDHSDLTRYLNKYLTYTSINIVWTAWDYLKPGLPVYDGAVFCAEVKNCYKKGETYLYKLAFDREIEKKYGLAHFWVKVEGENVEINWYNKKSGRLPQAIWLKFKGFKEKWQVRKLGGWIDPENTIGSPLIMATDYGVTNGESEIISYDACLVAPFGRRLYDFEKNPKGQDLYFNLYNNIWNTNFPIWYSDDTRFRFKVKKVDGK